MKCSIDGCGNAVLSRGWCSTHYTRAWRHGSPHAGGPVRTRHVAPTLAGRLHEWVEIADTDECIEFPGSRVDGYGNFRFQDRIYKAHIASYLVHVGEIPEGLLVRHSCDNRPCVNPRHLSIGTHEDNKRDSMERGRHTHGSRAKTSVLSESDVILLRTVDADIPAGEAAKKYGITVGHVSNVRRGRVWKHVDPPAAI